MQQLWYTNGRACTILYVMRYSQYTHTPKTASERLYKMVLYWWRLERAHFSSAQSL